MIEKWTKDRLTELAKAYSTKIDFKRNNRSAYEAARKNGLLPEICAHMQPQRRSLTKEVVAKIAKTYTTRREFELGDGSAYFAARENDWLDEVCSHMRKVYTEWTKEAVAEIAKAYNSKTAFIRGNSAAYQAGRRGKYLDEICSHMHRPSGIGGFDPTKSGYLYQIKFVLEDGTSVWKVGITNLEIKSRIAEFRLPKGISHEITHSIPYSIGADARTEEKRLHAIGSGKGLSYKGKRFLKKGNTELFLSPLL